LAVSPALRPPAAEGHAENHEAEFNPDKAAIDTTPDEGDDSLMAAEASGRAEAAQPKIIRNISVLTKIA
jgi:hypothetical protein